MLRKYWLNLCVNGKLDVLALKIPGEVLFHLSHSSWKVCNNAALPLQFSRHNSPHILYGRQVRSAGSPVQYLHPVLRQLCLCGVQYEDVLADVPPVCVSTSQHHYEKQCLKCFECVHLALLQIIFNSLHGYYVRQRESAAFHLWNSVQKSRQTDSCHPQKNSIVLLLWVVSGGHKAVHRRLVNCFSGCGGNNPLILNVKRRGFDCGF